MKVGDVIYVAYEVTPNAIPIAVCEGDDMDGVMLALDNYTRINDPKEKYAYMIAKKEIMQVIPNRAERREQVDMIRAIDREYSRQKTAALKNRPTPPLPASRKRGW